MNDHISTTFDIEIKKIKDQIYHAIQKWHPPFPERIIPLQRSSADEEFYSPFIDTPILKKKRKEEEKAKRKKHKNWGELLPLHYYLIHDEWRKNLSSIVKWLESNKKKKLDDFLEKRLNDSKWLYTISQTEEFRDEIGSFESRFNFFLEIGDFNYMDVSKFLINHFYLNDLMSENKEYNALLEFRANSIYSPSKDFESIYNLFHKEATRLRNSLVFSSDIAERIACYELEQEYLKKFRKHFHSISFGVELFEKSFLELPKDSDQRIYNNINEIYAEAFLTHNTCLFFLTGYPDPYALFPVTFSKPPHDCFLFRQISSLMQIKIELLENYFDLFIERELENKNKELTIDNKINLLNQLAVFYEKTKQSRGNTIILFEGIGMPDEVINLFCEYLIQIISKKIASLNGTILEKIVMPIEYNGVLSKTLEEKKLAESILQKLTQFNPSRDINLDRSFFEHNKMKWSEEQKYIDLLLELFKPLYSQKKSNGEYYMIKEDVIEMLKLNFTCFRGKFEPRTFRFNGHTSTLRFFILNIFRFVDKETEIEILQKRWLQFMLQNFSAFSVRLQKMKTEKDFKGYIKVADHSKPIRFGEIKINKKKLKTIIKNDPDM